MSRNRTRSWRALDVDTLIQGRLTPDAAVARVAEPKPRPVLAVNVRILGLDPGSRVTGFGVIECRGSDYKHVAHGCIAVAGLELADRLRRIFEGLTALILEHGPGEIAVERVFVNRNVESALKLGQARGAALCAIPEGVPVFEYAPRAVKLALVGSGAAEKAQVGHMIKTLLQLNEKISSDASDALAIAVCHAHTRKLHQLASR
jgi:crossover junction endodeoxyribonuclease RuvC